MTSDDERTLDDPVSKPQPQARPAILAMSSTRGADALASPSHDRPGVSAEPVTTGPAAIRLAVRGLECRRGERSLFKDLDFTVRRGDIVWVRGANGQGKTTLLRTLAGLSAPASGEIAFDRTEPGPAMLYIAHANALKEDLSVAESLRFLLSLSVPESARDPVRLDAALARLAMSGRRRAPVRTLSQGQRRRVALARLAVDDTAPVWLLDEPFDALDAEGCDTLNALLVEHARGGGAIVLTSHTPLAITDPAPRVVTLEPARAE